MQARQKTVVLTGLALGAALGMAGTFVAGDHLRAVLWAIDGTGLIVATTILALHYFRSGKDGIAAGFLVYAIGESIMLGGTAGDLIVSVPTFAGGTALWAAALAMTCAPREFALWTRIAGLIGAALFAATSIEIFAGAPVTQLTKPLPSVAYPFLVLTFIGWAVAVIRTPRAV
ncbi:MAG TPA: hypothetical protein VG714_03205 [Acidobacteriaceae bacterium]|nr:hypothetical protein [Acidobacteriaceae bacterium]